jgi:3-methylfumaryl-CoA hydratase
MATDKENFSEWVGRTETVSDFVDLSTAQSAAATLESSGKTLDDGSALPPLWHWFYFLGKTPQAQLGEDGHPRRVGHGFMPPIPYPRRMFAGARVRWHRPLIIGRPAHREATIKSIAIKSGKSGELAFVTVEYQLHQDKAICVQEEQDIVYKQPGPHLPAPVVSEFPAAAEGTWTRVIAPDSRLLFRFSALTFNAHRIHYDRPYAMSDEGYPGLVVHGPLTAMLLMGMVEEHTDRPIRSFAFRGQAPLFDLAPFQLLGTPSGDKVELLAQGPDTRTAMTASAELG